MPPLQGLTLEDMKKRAICEALERNQGRRMASVRELGVDKNILRRKMKRHNLSPTCMRHPWAWNSPSIVCHILCLTP
jgi:DNA-binding NtrC family response regulator